MRSDVHAHKARLSIDLVQVPSTLERSKCTGATEAAHSPASHNFNKHNLQFHGILAPSPSLLYSISRNSHHPGTALQVASGFGECTPTAQTDQQPRDRDLECPKRKNDKEAGERARHGMAGNAGRAEGADEAESRAVAVEERQAAAETKDLNNVCLPASMFWRLPKLTAYL